MMYQKIIILLQSICISWIPEIAPWSEIESPSPLIHPPVVVAHLGLAPTSVACSVTSLVDSTNVHVDYFYSIRYRKNGCRSFKKENSTEEAVSSFYSLRYTTILIDPMVEYFLIRKTP
mmetsp:Transcript_15970/g.24281  ORF Transcript_15970/g.24281 Transcript_15970/m.24281 type:complete len:118 (-) Transcript_15970:252-605(-)